MRLVKRRLKPATTQGFDQNSVVLVIVLVLVLELSVIKVLRRLTTAGWENEHEHEHGNGEGNIEHPAEGNSLVRLL